MKNKLGFWEGSAFSFLPMKARKWIGRILIVLALLLALPPLVPTLIDDLINIFLASWLVSSFGIEQFTALLITYTIIPFGIFLLGVYIYPARNGYVITKFKKIFVEKWNSFLKKVKKQPLYLILILIVFVVLWKAYEFLLGGLNA